VVNAIELEWLDLSDTKTTASGREGLRAVGIEVECQSESLKLAPGFTEVAQHLSRFSLLVQPDAASLQADPSADNCPAWTRYRSS
jgi:hypothetical protein